MRIASATAVLVFGLAVAPGLRADGPRVIQRDMTLGRSGGSPTISASFEEVYDQELKKRLSSGFSSRIIVEVWLRDRQRQIPLAQGLYQVTAVYDIWEEHFVVQLLGPEGERRLVINDMAALLRACGSLKDLRLNLLMEASERTEVEAEMRVTVNPALPGLREKVRQYLANPEGGRRLGSPRSFFGSFSRIFVSERDIQADSIYIFRSPPLLLEKTQSR